MEGVNNEETNGNDEVTSYLYYKSLAEGRLTTIHKQRADIAQLRITLWKAEEKLRQTANLRCQREEALRNVIYKDMDLSNLLILDMLITDWKSRTTYVLESLQDLENETLTTEQQTAMVHACIRTLRDMDKENNIERPRYPIDTPNYTSIALD
jgi:hypothetical protein